MTDPSTPPAPLTTAPALAIDEVLPAFDVNLVEHIVVNADPDTTYEALLRADRMESPVATLMIRARDLPNLLGSRQVRAQPTARERVTILSLIHI